MYTSTLADVFTVAVVFYKYDSAKQTSVSLLFVFIYLPLYLVPGLGLSPLTGLVSHEVWARAGGNKCSQAQREGGITGRF